VKGEETQETKDQIMPVMLVCIRSTNRFGHLMATLNSQQLSVTWTKVYCKRYLDDGALSDCCANVKIFSTQRSSSAPENCILRPHISSNISFEAASTHTTTFTRSNVVRTKGQIPHTPEQITVIIITTNINSI